MAFGFKVKPNFSVENEKAIATPPKVDFGPATSAPAAPVPAQQSESAPAGQSPLSAGY
jgi:LemA protein